MATKTIETPAIAAQTEMAETLSDMALLVSDSPNPKIREQSAAWRALFGRIVAENKAGRWVDLNALVADMPGSCSRKEFCPIRGK